MNWDRSETIGLAKEFCAVCGGSGIRDSRAGQMTPCSCVFRGIFRACYARFRYCVTKEKHISKVSLVARQGKERKLTYERLIEDYIADFCLVSRRSLTESEHRIFRYHYLLGADWRLCCRQLKMDRGTFFHSVYHIQQKLGRIFRELRPYSLYPVDEYFAGRVKTLRRDSLPPAPVIVMPPRNRVLRPPLQRSA
jgi:hypothetical protein